MKRIRKYMHVEYNYKYDCIVDPYTYPGTAILRNKFNIRDSSVLSKVERRITRKPSWFSSRRANSPEGITT